MAVSTTHLTSWLLIRQPTVEVESASRSLKCIYLRRSTAFSSRKGTEVWRGKGSQESEAESAQEPGVPVPLQSTLPPMH